MLGTQFLPQEQPPSAASKGLRLKPDVSQIGCDKQACDAGAAHVEGEATSHSGSAQELCLGCRPETLMKRSAGQEGDSENASFLQRLQYGFYERLGQDDLQYR